MTNTKYSVSIQRGSSTASETLRSISGIKPLIEIELILYANGKLMTKQKDLSKLARSACK